MKKITACIGLIGFAMGVMLSLVVRVWSGNAAPLTVSQAPANQGDKTFAQTEKLAELRRQIAGKERMPAEQVYKNIKDYKGVPAAGLLRGMEFYTRALGVDCLHCHVTDQWEKDDKPAKQIAREMSALVDSIQESLKKIKNLKSERPGISWKATPVFIRAHPIKPYSSRRDLSGS